MMPEISLNVLDVAENSTRAGASLVTITVDADISSDKLTVIIDDNGCGMTPEVLERLNSGDKRIPGGHLGLYNTDSIIRLRFGAAYGLTARSAPGEGSCVSLRLPIQREEAGDAEGADR